MSLPSFIPVMTSRQDGSSNDTMDNDLNLLTAPQPALFSLDLMSHETRPTYLKFGVPLFQAALKGDWDTAKGILEVFPSIVRARISYDGRTALHIAAAAKHTKFVIELVNEMNDEDLALQAENRATALCFAATSGQVEIAKVMVGRNPNLIMMRDNVGLFPLSIATMLGHKDMTLLLYHATKDHNDLTLDDRIELLINMINNNLYDVALDMLQNHKELATARAYNCSRGETALHAFAQKPLKASTLKGVWWRRCTKFFSGVDMVNDDEYCMHPKALELVKCLWDQIILSDNILELIKYPWGILSVATELGNVAFLVVLIRSYPSLLWQNDKYGCSIFRTAVLHRQEKIFALINEISEFKDLFAIAIDEKQNNMLHFVGMLAPPSRLNIVPGAALQMRRELLWFKEVEKNVHPFIVEAKNDDGYTPRALFTESHKELMKQGETWMKETAASCMLVATLIATIMFAAIFTLPGGSNDTTGDPIYRKKVAFMFFAVSDAIGLLSSSTAILNFLSILTSRYAEEDFLASLPTKLVIGIAMLFISLAAMMVVFCSTFFIVFYHGVEWIPIPIALVACVPVISFGFLLYRLLLI